MHVPYVTTFVVSEQAEKLSPLLMETLQEKLEAMGANCVSLHWLEPGRACDIYHGEMPPQPALRALDAQLQIECDRVSQSTQHRQKKLLVSDMDSTMIHQECIDELADYMGIKPKVAAITERAMNGELEFKAALRERVGLLKGLPKTALQEVYTSRITAMEGAQMLVRTMKKHGAYGLLVSGGFTFFTQRVRMMLGFDEDQSNQLLWDGDALSGKVAEPILDKESKLQSLLAACAKLEIDTQQAMAVGDGANDLPMLQAAGLGVAYRAKPVVQAAASAAITHGDLSALLYVQGYAKDQWVCG